MPEQRTRRVEKPWGYEVWWAQSEHYIGKFLHLNAGQRLSVQVHREKDETSYLLSGRLRLSEGPSPGEMEEREISVGSAWRVRAGTVHTIEALEGSIVVEVSTPHPDDVVRLEDRYGR